MPIWTKTKNFIWTKNSNEASHPIIPLTHLMPTKMWSSKMLNTGDFRANFTSPITSKLDFGNLRKQRLKENAERWQNILPVRKAENLEDWNTNLQGFNGAVQTGLIFGFRLKNSREKNSKLKKKTQNSSQKLNILAFFF